MAAIQSLKKINLSDRQSLQSVLNFLEKYLPQSSYLWRLLKNTEQNLITKQHIWPHQLFVHDQNQITNVLFIYSTIGFTPNYDSITEDEKLSERDVIYFCDEKDDSLLIPMIQQYVPWSKTKSIYFPAIVPQFSTKIQKFINDNNLGKFYTAPHHQMQWDKEIFQKSKNMTYSHPSDIVIRPLSVSDAAMINDLWPYKSQLSLPVITYEIKHLPSAGAYRDGKLLSWCLTKYDGCIGTGFTIPEARRLGLMSILNIYLASKLFEFQERVFTYVSPNNIASLRMLEKLGYRRTCDLDWGEFRSKAQRLAP